MSDAGNAVLKGTLSVGRAVTIGRLWVNGPVLLLIVGPILGFLAADSSGVLPRERQWIAFSLCGVGWLLAWLWWSLTVPRWRLWAYQRVVDVAALKQSAVQAGLTWPDGSVFGRTEIKSREHMLREQQLEQQSK